MSEEDKIICKPPKGFVCETHAVVDEIYSHWLHNPKTGEWKTEAIKHMEVRGK